MPIACAGTSNDKNPLLHAIQLQQASLPLCQCLEGKDFSRREFPLTGRDVDFTTANSSTQAGGDADADDLDTAGAAVEISRLGGHMATLS